MQPTIENLKKVYNILEDEESRFTYLNRLNYLVTGDIAHMLAIVDRYLPELPRYKSKSLEEVLSQLPSDKKFVLFGAGGIGKAYLPLFQKDSRFWGFCSSTKEKQKNGFMGYPVMSPEELFANRNLSVIISAASAKQEIEELLSKSGYPQDLIFTLDGYQTAYNDQYFGPDFMMYEDEEVFLDVGSCNLRDSIYLRDHCRHVKKVYAFEPDLENYKVCERNKETYQFPEVELLPFGAWSEDTTLHFSAVGSGTSCVNDNGEISVSVRAIDHVIPEEEQVTFIKMDIEGSELEALKGARHTIQRCKPKLAISLYHKPEDMTEIPLYIQSLVPEYKFYVRHHSNCYTETVFYAIFPH